MDKNENKNGRNIGTYYNINIQHMVETVASNTFALLKFYFYHIVMNIALY